MQNLNTKETMARGVIVLNVSEMPQENISVGKGQNYLLVGDNAIWLKKIPDNSIDSIVTDPPAGISFMGRGWDTDKGGRDHWIAWMQEVATECKRVLKPGGHAFVWAIPRTSHWTATAWENAGFEIRDVVAHIFGSGFPKSLNIGKAVDKLQGNEREVSGYKERFGREGRKANCGFKEEYVGASGTQDQSAMKPIMLPVSEEAKQWEGWGTALKPAREDWLLMRKPLSEKTVAENVLKYGTGGINIDESRVGTEDKLQSGTGAFGKSGIYGTANGQTSEQNSLGRFPANLIHDNSEEVRECFPETKSGNLLPGHKRGDGTGNSLMGGGGVIEGTYGGDSGNASRFFKSIIYQAKASKSERNKGCEELEEKDSMKWAGGNEMKGLAGKYPDGTPRPIQIQKNNHPTVKPIALMEYLIKMVTPKGGVVLDPFAGSGSTLVAAKQNGFNYMGIEMTEEYIPIIEARLNAIISSSETQK
jgi:DNA modification methylase